jgi:hypothetical protein
MSEKIISKNKGIGSINNIIKTISAAFKTQEKPIAPLPPPLILSGANLRVGLSSKAIAGRVISRLSEAGLPVGDVYADGPNTFEAALTITIEEIISAMLTEAKVELVIPPGTNVTTVGLGNLGIPVISQGATTNMGVGNGVIR